MTQPLYLYLSDQNQDTICEEACLAFSLEREAYTPYESVTATFLSRSTGYPHIRQISIMSGTEQIFSGLVDSIQQYHQQNACLVKIRSRSFTSLLTQNELEAGLHSNLTMQSLMTNYYQFPHITYENTSGDGYIFVKAGNTMWDGVVSFGYKSTGHYPFVVGNHIHLSQISNPLTREYTEKQLIEYGTCTETTRLISHYHMEDILGTPNGYQQENPAAANFDIVRHKQISFDSSFRHDPDDALTFRNLYSRRGSHASYLVYNGFNNETLGQKLTCGTHIQNETICRVLAVFGINGFRTKLWCYHDGFYNHD